MPDTDHHTRIRNFHKSCDLLRHASVRKLVFNGGITRHPALLWAHYQLLRYAALKVLLLYYLCYPYLMCFRRFTLDEHMDVEPSKIHLEKLDKATARFSFTLSCNTGGLPTRRVSSQNSTYWNSLHHLHSAIYIHLTPPLPSGHFTLWTFWRSQNH